MIDETTLIRELTQALSAVTSLTVSADRADGECMTLRLGGGEDGERFLDGGRRRVIPLLILTKSIDGEKALSDICKAVELLEAEPPRSVLQAVITSYPQLVDRGEDGAIYEAQAELSCYEEGTRRIL